MFVRCIVQFVFADSEKLCGTWQYQRLMLHCAGLLTFTDIRSLGFLNSTLRLSMLSETFVRFSRKTIMSLRYVVTCIGIYIYRHFGSLSFSSIQFCLLRQRVSLKLWHKSPRIHDAVHHMTLFFIDWVWEVQILNTVSTVKIVLKFCPVHF
jgi:hypothetical protein